MDVRIPTRPVTSGTAELRLAWKVLDQLRDGGREPRNLDAADCELIASVGFYKHTLPLAIIATDILTAEQPMTLRGLFYRVVSAGALPSTDRAHYDRLGRIMGKLREAGVVPFTWLVDHLRTTLKPSSWSGLADFADTVRDAYRRDFWASLDEYVHVFVEKDAMAGVLEPVSDEFDVPLSVIRGFVSISFAHEVADLWSRIPKRITAYYMGDFDPSGLSLEDDLRAKLERYCGDRFEWKRLAVRPSDFERFELFPLTPKPTDTRTRWFRDQGYTECAELDAIPAESLRERLRAAIQAHIPADEWERLRRVEDLERTTWHRTLAAMHPESQA